MPEENGHTGLVKKILDDASVDILEERVIAYIVRELHSGRKMSKILNDPYVRNRVNEERLNELLENEEVVGAVEEELEKAFSKWDFKFKN